MSGVRYSFLEHFYAFEVKCYCESKNDLFVITVYKWVVAILLKCGDWWWKVIRLQWFAVLLLFLQLIVLRTTTKTTMSIRDRVTIIRRFYSIQQWNLDPINHATSINRIRINIHKYVSPQNMCTIRKTYEVPCFYKGEKWFGKRSTIWGNTLKKLHDLWGDSRPYSEDGLMLADFSNDILLPRPFSLSTRRTFCVQNPIP